MYINIFSSYPALAQILCLLVVAGLIGYFFSHLISGKKVNMKLKIYDQKIYKLEASYEDLEALKDKQALLFDSKKELTLKINEFDALLGLTSEVDSISKTLNSLNFVPYDEFTNAVDSQSKEIEKFVKENKEVFNNHLEKSNQEIENITKSIPEQIQQAGEKWTTNINENKSEVNSVKSKNLELNEKVSKIFDSTEELQKSINELSESLASRSEQISSYDQKMDDLNQEMNKYADLPSQLNQAEELATKSAKGIDDLLKLETSVMDLKNDMFSNQKELKFNREEIQKMAEERALLKNQFDEALSSLNTKNYENEIGKESSDKIERDHDPEETEEQFNIGLESMRDKVMENIHISVQPPESKKNKTDPLVDHLSICDLDREVKDDLKLIKGIGPVLEKKINRLGLYNFEQISQLSKSDIKAINQAMSLYNGKVQKDNWKSQAKKLQKQKEQVS